MWPELPAEAIGVHPLQYRGDAALVSANELGDAADGGRLQRYGGIAVTAAIGGGCPLGILRLPVPGMDVVRP
jgi:hypothetical protein